MNKDIEQLAQAKLLAAKQRYHFGINGDLNGIISAMCEMYNEALQSSTLRWVKASERLPEGKSGFPNQVITRWSFNDGGKQMRVTTVNQLLDAIKLLVDLSKLEWLEESVDKEGRDLDASSNTTMNVPCDAPLYSGNSIQRLRQLIELEIKQVEALGRYSHTMSAQSTKAAYEKVLRFIDQSTNKSNPTPFNSSKEQDKYQFLYWLKDEKTDKSLRVKYIKAGSLEEACHKFLDKKPEGVRRVDYEVEHNGEYLDISDIKGFENYL